MKKILIILSLLFLLAPFASAADIYHYTQDYGTTICNEHNLGSIYFIAYYYQAPTYAYKSYLPTTFSGSSPATNSGTLSGTYPNQCTPMGNWTAVAVYPNNGTGWDTRPGYGSYYYLNAYYSTTPRASFVTNYTAGGNVRPINYTFTGSVPSTKAWSSNPSTGVTFSDPSGTNGTITFPSPGTYNISVNVTIGVASNSAYKEMTFADTTVPNVNFTASPTYGFLPLQVQFTDTSNQTNSQWSWNYGDGQSSNGSVSNPIHTYSAPGVYTVRMDAYSASYGWYNLTRTNYITATNPSGVVFNVDIKDSISGALIQDSAVGIRNTTSGVWRNGTAPTGLIYYDTTDPGYLYPLSLNQSVTIAASKTGYREATSTFNIPYDNYRAFLYLVPLSVVNETGKGTVVATVVRNKDGLPLSGTSVTLSTGQMGITNSAGAVTLRNVTAGTPTATAINSGYQTTSSTFTLSAGETKMVVIQMVLDGESPVTTYGSPTPTRTPGPGDPGYAGVNTSSGALNERGSTGLMEMMGQLIELWPLVLIILFMKFMKDAFS